jgi:hypothetical protein
MSKKYHVREKRFLNLDKEELDYIVAVVEDAREKHIDHSGSAECSEISLRIADWRYEIELFFDLETAEQRENSLHKIKTLAEVIDSFKRAIENEIEVMNAGESFQRHVRVSSAVH